MVYIADKPAGINVLAAYAGAHALGDQTRRTNILADETARRTQAYEANVGSQIEQRNEAIRQMRAAAAQDAAATQARLAAEESAMLGRRLQVAEGIARQEMEANGQLSDGTFNAMRDLMAAVSPDDVPGAEAFQNTPETSAMLAAGISGALSGWRMDTGTMPPEAPGPNYGFADGQYYDKNNPAAGARPIPGFVQDTGEQMTVYGPDGNPILHQGAAGTQPKFTEGQSKDNVFKVRGEGALSVLDSVGAENLTSRGEHVAEAVPFGLGRGLQSDDFQVAKQAGDEFLQAILRKDTGAAITEGEQALYGETYLPRPGDGPAVLEAKLASRIRALEALEAGMNIQQVTVTERALIDAARRAGQSAARSGGGIPQGAVDLLKSDPSDERRRYFDEAFGEGAAAQVLGK